MSKRKQPNPYSGVKEPFPEADKKGEDTWIHKYKVRIGIMNHDKFLERKDEFISFLGNDFELCVDDASYSLHILSKELDSSTKKTPEYICNRLNAVSQCVWCW
jgi:hypothetical protein